MNCSDRCALYRDQVLAAFPRILTELDRDPLSSTYGSFDREYWAWSTKDFSNIDLQRAIYPLTVLYLTPANGNVWYRLPRAKAWIRGAFGFWRKSQHRNGSFDHHYPNEFSFVGTAFPLFEIAETFRLLDEAGELDTSERNSWISVMERAADFLRRHDELHGFISNHRIGAACALYAVYLITGAEAYRCRARIFIDSVKKKVSESESWLDEYGGADPGYQTLDTHYMAHYVRLSGDQEFYEAVVAPSIRFLVYFFHPDGSVGGEYGSRNSPLYFPYGLELFAKCMPEAEAVAALSATAIVRGMTPGLLDMDIRNFVPLLSSYIQAMQVGSTDASIAPSDLPFHRTFERYWPKAGLFVRSDDEHYTIVGCAKGGVVKVFSKTKARLVASHAGYMVETVDGASFSNQFLAEFTVEGVDDCVGREAPLQVARTLHLIHPFFSVIRHRAFTPFRFLLFRLFTLTVGRNVWIANWAKRAVITGLFIHRRKRSTTMLARRIYFGPDGMAIEDSLRGLSTERLKSLRAGDFFTTIYMASSKYYRHGECIPDTLNLGDLAALVRQQGPQLRYQLTNNELRLDLSQGPEAATGGVVAEEHHKGESSCAVSSAG